MISAGEFAQASGTWVSDRMHGVQFRAAFLKATVPTTIEGIEKYLGSGTIRGIGPIYARQLVRAFGNAVFDVIEQEPDRLRKVTGIGPKGAEGRSPKGSRRSRPEDRPGRQSMPTGDSLDGAADEAGARR
jgi:exodeoxyribonuclease V alpha subunit